MQVWTTAPLGVAVVEFDQDATRAKGPAPQDSGSRITLFTGLPVRRWAQLAAFARDGSQVSWTVWAVVEFALHPEIVHPAAGVISETVLEVPFYNIRKPCILRDEAESNLQQP